MRTAGEECARTTVSKREMIKQGPEKVEIW